MTWFDVIMTAEFLLLCAIAYGVYRLKQAIEDIYSGLGELLGQHRDIAEKILFQLDSGDAVPRPPGPRFPLHVEVHTIQEDLRDFKNKWFELHIPDFARNQLEERERRKRFGKLGEHNEKDE